MSPTNYIDPGVYIKEAVQPRAGGVLGLGLSLCIVGEGSKSKRVIDEVHRRGQVIGETLTVSSTSPHTATLLNTSNQKQQDSVVYKNGVRLPNEAWQFNSATVIQILDAYWTAGAIYTIDYIAIDTLVDFLDNVDVQKIVSLGLFPGSANFKENVDFIQSGDNIDWNVAVQATFTGANSEPFNTSVNNKIKLSLNGKPGLEITLTSGGAVSAATIASDINSALNASSDYGADYNAVASAVAGKVKLTCPNISPYIGQASIITFLAPSGNDATNLIFGINTFPTTYYGTGKRPLPGTYFYVTYEYKRPDSDYNVVKRFFSDKDFYADIGNVNRDNPLAIAGSIAFAAGVPDLHVVQVKDADNDGIYIDADYINAINALRDKVNVTEIVVLRSTPLIRANVVNLVETESAETKSNFKRYWCGVPRGMSIGDIDTAETIVYVARRELQVSATSPGRGRFILCAPTKFKKVITEEDGTQVEVTLDSNYRAVADAAKEVTLSSFADTLLRKAIVGIEQEEEYTDEERRYLTSNGVSVSVLDGSRIVLFDPVTTDVSGNIEFQEISASVQKDNISFKMKKAVDANIIGIVPDDLADFIGSIKSVVGGVLLAAIEAGEIGPFVDEQGRVRDIDYARDIVAFRSATDPTKYFFRYWFNLKYPAKRVFGVFSVDSPFALTV